MLTPETLKTLTKELNDIESKINEIEGKSESKLMNDYLTKLVGDYNAIVRTINSLNGSDLTSK